MYASALSQETTQQIYRPTLLNIEALKENFEIQQATVH